MITLDRHGIEKKIDFLFQSEFSSRKLKVFIFDLFDEMENEMARLEGHLKEIGELTSGNKPPTEKEKSTEERISELERALLKVSTPFFSGGRFTVAMEGDKAVICIEEDKVEVKLSNKENQNGR